MCLELPECSARSASPAFTDDRECRGCDNEYEGEEPQKRGKVMERGRLGTQYAGGGEQDECDDPTGEYRVLHRSSKVRVHDR